jgi:hypothetical protein
VPFRFAFYSGCGGAVDRLDCGPSAKPCGSNWHSGLWLDVKTSPFPECHGYHKLHSKPYVLGPFPAISDGKMRAQNRIRLVAPNVTDEVSTLASVPGPESPISAQSVPVHHRNYLRKQLWMVR